LSAQNDDTGLGALALALVAHLYQWELPPGIAVGGCLLGGEKLGRYAGFTADGLERATQKAGLRVVFLDEEAVLWGAETDPPIVKRVRSFLEMVSLVWAPVPADAAAGAKS
jgi:hypothetical protein